MPVEYKHSGLSFHIYFDDHPPLHVHVKYGEFSLTINIKTREIISGYLPSKQRKLAICIIEERETSFMSKFNEYSK